jgi:1-acyl-sn-glycerol-3-phosphate acyltransferase
MQVAIYVLLRAFLQLVTRIFFRTAEVVGREHVPVSGAVIVVVNHPNSLVDPLLVTTTCPRRLRFAARDGLFAIPVLRSILWALGSVPIKRRQDHGENGPAVDNSEAFARLHAVLAEGGVFGLFPEGVSYTEPELQPLKTGAARIALSALSAGIPVVIVPAGLSYRRKHRFRSRVLVQYGRPFALGAEWAERQTQDPKAAARALTDEMGLALRALTINASDFDTLRVLDGIRRLYVPPERRLSLAEQAEITRRLVDHWEAKQDVPDVVQFYVDMSEYLDRLDGLGMSDWDLRKPISRWSWFVRLLRHVALMFVAVPFALAGLVLYSPILWGATRAGELLIARDDVQATMRMIVATLVLLLMHGLLLVGLIATDPTLLGVVRSVGVLLLLAVSGLATIRVLEKQAVIRHGFRVLRRVFFLRRDLHVLRAARDDLRRRLVALVQVHADPTLERIVSDEELAR